MFINVPALLWILGGSLVGAVLSGHGRNLWRLPRTLWEAVRPPSMDPTATSQRLLALLRMVRREGILGLEDEVTPTDHPLLQQAAPLLLDGVEAEALTALARTEMEQAARSDRAGPQLCATLGQLSPALGVGVTLLGLIRTLHQGGDWSATAPVVAQTMTATLYGIGLAHLLWFPLESWLRARAEARQEIREIILVGLLALRAGENPRLLAERLAAYLPPPSEEETKAVWEVAA
jgi:chemotaxis protein MotA